MVAGSGAFEGESAALGSTWGEVGCESMPSRLGHALAVLQSRHHGDRRLGVAGSANTLATAAFRGVVRESVGGMQNNGRLDRRTFSRELVARRRPGESGANVRAIEHWAADDVAMTSPFPTSRCGRSVARGVVGVQCLTCLLP